jgi:hypothetical protein
MLHARMLATPLVVGSLLPACVSLAPGADKVRLTKTVSDVSACTTVGNLNVPRGPNGGVDLSNAEVQFRNQVIGLGGNTGFITRTQMGIPAEGIAYRCP